MASSSVNMTPYHHGWIRTMGNLISGSAKKAAGRVNLAEVMMLLRRTIRETSGPWGL